LSERFQGTFGHLYSGSTVKASVSQLNGS